MKVSELGVNQEKIKSISSANFKYILEKREISIEDLAHELETPVDMLSSYVEGNEIPPVNILLSLKKLYGISIDNFLTLELEFYTPIKSYNISDQLAIIQKIRRFCGVYYIHYFDTTIYKYTNISEKMRPRINSGLLQIYEEKTPLGNSRFRVVALTGCTRSECTKFFAEIEAKNDINTLYDLDISKVRSYHFYQGEIDGTSHNMFISLSSEFRDKCLMIFQNPDSTKPYLGGIGTVNSVSRGHESMPCAQFILMTRNTLTCDENEIAEMLYLSYRKLTFSDEENFLVSRLRKILQSSNSVSGVSLTDDETEMLISHNIEKIVNNLIRHQYFKCATISIQDDYNWYKSMEKYLSPDKDE